MSACAVHNSIWPILSSRRLFSQRLHISKYTTLPTLSMILLDSSPNGLNVSVLCRSVVSARLLTDVLRICANLRFFSFDLHLDTPLLWYTVNSEVDFELLLIWDRFPDTRTTLELLIAKDFTWISTPFCSNDACLSLHVLFKVDLDFRSKLILKTRLCVFGTSVSSSDFDLWMIILITASWSSKCKAWLRSEKVLRLSQRGPQWTTRHSLRYRVSPFWCWCWCVCFESHLAISISVLERPECNTSITKSQRSSVGIPSMRRPASNKITSDFVELCETLNFVSYTSNL